uniref:Uncharacterized protein n=1 Tax=Monopterus albus TaxID=43700 RepID=A0A3Q3IU13_MONAL
MFLYSKHVGQLRIINTRSLERDILVINYDNSNTVTAMIYIKPKLFLIIQSEETDMVSTHFLFQSFNPSEKWRLQLTVQHSNFYTWVLFADDTTIWASGENLQQLSGRVSQELEKIKKWCDSNKLSLNLDKTKFMVFGNRRLDNELQLKIGGANIERISSALNSKAVDAPKTHLIKVKPRSPLAPGNTEPLNHLFISAHT